MKAWRSIRIVAGYELSDAIRSRRAVVVLLLYLLGAMAACNGFITVLHKLEVQLAEMLALPASAQVGTVVDALWKSPRFQRMIVHLVGNRDVAMELLSVPPFALLYGWLAFTFTPVLVMLTTPSRIAEEIGTGSARFVLVRTSRFRWCLGKFAGQSLLVLLALLLSAAGAWAVARLRMQGMDGPAAAGGILFYALRAWIYSLAFVGLALSLSLATRSGNLAVVLGLLAWLGLTVLSHAARNRAGEGLGILWELAERLTPQGHRLDLWRPRAVHVLPAGVFVCMLGVGYMLSGYLCFRRKDL